MESTVLSQKVVFRTQGYNTFSYQAINKPPSTVGNGSKLSNIFTLQFFIQGFLMLHIFGPTCYWTLVPGLISLMVKKALNMKSKRADVLMCMIMDYLLVEPIKGLKVGIWFLPQFRKTTKQLNERMQFQCFIVIYQVFPIRNCSYCSQWTSGPWDLNCEI